MSETSVTIKGLAELKTTLEELSQKAADSCIRKALRAGGEEMRDAVIERAPVNEGRGGVLPEGAIKADISVRVTKQNKDGFTAIIGPGKYTEWIARLVEYGHRMVHGGRSYLIKQGKNAGKTKGPGIVHADSVPEHPFIRPAYETTKEHATETVCKTLATEIEKAAGRLNKSRLK